MYKYTKLPDIYTTKYNSFFNKDIIGKKYNNDIWLACEQNPYLFAYFLIGIKERDYQLFTNDALLKYRFNFLLWSRRLGKSTMFIIFSLWAMKFNKFPQGLDNSTKIIVVAHTKDGAERYISEIYSLMEAGDSRVEQLFGIKKFFTKSLPSKGKDKMRANQSMINMKSVDGKWCSIKTSPPTTRSRGEPASVIICDEIAFWCDYASEKISDHRIYNEVVRPIITENPNSKLFLATTPNGETGLAYDLLFPLKGETIFNLIWLPYTIRSDKTYLEEMAKTKLEYESQGRHDEFRQEYGAELISKSNSYFDIENEVNKVFSNDGFSFYPYYAGECHLGLDFGGSKNSHTVITISRYDIQTKTVLRLYKKSYPIGKDSTLQNDLFDIVKRFPNITKFHIDSQGGGSSFYSWFNEKFGGSKIDEVNFKAVKVDMYRQFKIACYQNRVKSFYDPDLRREFLDFTSDLKPVKGSTDDELDSFVMSCKDWVEDKVVNKYNVIRY